VSPLAARGFAGGTRIVYRTQQQPLRVQRYDELLWESPPASAIADALVAALRAGRVFEHVIVAGDPARADFLLSGELTRFEHRPTDQPPGVSVEFSLALIQARGRGLLASNNYVGFEPTVNGADGRTTPEAMVAAFDRVTGRLIEQAIRDVQALPPERFR
ncbi:ABC-type transport auxiliary lipoprotein family protein, partial [Thiohalocapsa marina]|uniref:ABC-type transport auxiliary lipoprotein family protein n=1 Tax=Thiohalocapsa marina TaxID=424902 RepID=UPI0036DA79E9